jgi:hypothetical protein
LNRELEKRVNDVVTRHTLVRRKDDIINATGLLYIGDYTDEAFLMRIKGIFREEREHLSAAEVAAIRTESDGVQVSEVGEA